MKFQTCLRFKFCFDKKIWNYRITNFWNHRNFYMMSEISVWLIWEFIWNSIFCQKFLHKNTLNPYPAVSQDNPWGGSIYIFWEQNIGKKFKTDIFENFHCCIVRDPDADSGPPGIFHFDPYWPISGECQFSKWPIFSDLWKIWILRQICQYDQFFVRKCVRKVCNTFLTPFQEGLYISMAPIFVKTDFRGHPPKYCAFRIFVISHFLGNISFVG